MKFLLIGFALVCFVSAALFGYTWYRLRSQLHFHAQADLAPVPEGWPTDLHYVTNPDQQKIAYLYFPVPKPKAVVILVHGYDNPGGKTQMLGLAQYLHELGYSTVLPDLRAYGDSEGQRMWLGTKEWQDVIAVYDQIHSQPETQKTKIGFLGVSMGGATALTAVGETGKGDFVIASVPFELQSLFKYQIAAAGFPPQIFYPLMKLAAIIELGAEYHQFTPATQVAKIKVPMLFIAATHDGTVDPHDAKLLYDLAEGPKQYVEINSRHDIFYYQPVEFKRTVSTFLQQHVQE